MRCLRIYASPDGESHFDEVDISTTERSIFPDAAPFELSAHYPASRIRFTRIPAGMRQVGWHTVPELDFAHFWEHLLKSMTYPASSKTLTH